jgi:hypothetical protein
MAIGVLMWYRVFSAQGQFHSDLLRCIIFLIVLAWSVSRGEQLLKQTRAFTPSYDSLILVKVLHMRLFIPSSVKPWLRTSNLM